MASGDTLVLFTALHNQLPASGGAPLAVRNSHPVLAFDDTTDESALFGAFLPRHYGGGGITATVAWTGKTATTGAARWQGFFERDDTGTDVDADSFDATGVSNGATTSGTSGQMNYTTLVFTNGARLDNLVVGEKFRFKLVRDADGTSGTDDMTGDAEVHGIELKES